LVIADEALPDGQLPDDQLPDGPLLAYCGDDFTGSTDVMEAFTAAGVDTVLFLAPPEPHWVQRFAGQRAIGLASTARGQSPAWMDAHLPDAFNRLLAFGAPILQYKVCSTFDSSPDTGSIGRAVDIGCALLPGRWSPMVVGAPRLKRYQAFGNLFAVVDGVGHRLDRHPTMSRHPVTPMAEADLGQRAVVDHVQQHQRLVWQGRGNGLFSASSSGLQYALAAHWRQRGWLPAVPSLPVAGAVDAIAVVSGSCSPVTAAQIDWAGQHGFALLRLDIARALSADASDAEVERLVAAAAQALAAGHSPLVLSASGPDDPAVTGFDHSAAAAGLSRGDAAQRVGERLAAVMRGLLDRCPALRRVVVAGGDSSGAVASALHIAALSIEAGLAPGAPLCRAWSDNPARDGLQLVLKGGQMGGDAFFGAVRQGRV